MVIFPIPKELNLKEGVCPTDAKETVVTDESLAKEEYRIVIDTDGITVFSSCAEGAFRAASTLKQIVAQNPKGLPCLTLHDWPDFPNRGIWYNATSRLPKMEEFKRILDLFADMKINHVQFELYKNNFAYPSFPQIKRDENAYTPEQITELCEYAKSRYIDLAPQMQTFGHVNGWLAEPDFADLAECPNGFEQWGRHQSPGTLNPLDPRSQELARKWLDDVMPCFKASGLFNIGCDETWELGQGRSKEACEKLGKTRIFLDFVQQTIAYMTEHGFKPMFWADIILQGSQEVLDAIPADSVALNWGYERFQVSEDSCVRLQKTGVPYWNCPGTSVWNSLLGQSYKAVQNIARCAVLGKKYGASGLLNTDWADDNLHHCAPSYFGFAYGAAQAWTVAEEDWKPEEGEEQQKALPEPDAAQFVKASKTAAACFDYLNRFVYMDQREKMAQVAYDAGLYGHISCHDGVGNSTNVKRVLVTDPAKPTTCGYDAQDFLDTKDYLDVISFRMRHETRMACADAQWILDEYQDSINMLKYACDYGLYLLGETGGMTPAAYAARMREKVKDILRSHNVLWLRRNRPFPNGAARYFRQFDER